MLIDIKRRELADIQKINSWILLYGRRKVGKTYLLRRLAHDAYFLVRRDGTILCEGVMQKRIDDAAVFSNLVHDMLVAGKTIIIDEYQRLPTEFFDELASSHPSGKVILSGSAVSTLHKFFGTSSPMLGLLAEYKLGLASSSDSLEATSHFKANSVPYAAFIRDPWLVPQFSYVDLVTDLYGIITRFKNAVPRLIGEAFQEENRELTKTYEAIIRQIGAGYYITKSLAHILSNKRVIEKDDSRLIHQFLANLVAMDLVEVVNVYGSKVKLHRLKSPAFELFYYLADRHSIEEQDVSLEEMRENILKVHNLVVQNFVGDIFAEKLGGNKECSISPEIDFIITKGRHREPVAVGEVKCGNWNESDVKHFVEKTKQFSCQKFFIVKEKKTSQCKEVQIIGWRELAHIFT